MEKEKKSYNRVLPKAINLLLREEKISFWEKLRKVVSIIAFSFLLIFLLTTIFTFFQSWFLSSYAASLEKRTRQAKEKISSLRKEEQVYLSLIKKIKAAKEILDSSFKFSQVLKEINLFLPLEITPTLAKIEAGGEVTIDLSCPSLLSIENLNRSLMNAAREGKILNVKINSLTKEENFYKLSLSFQILPKK